MQPLNKTALLTALFAALSVGGFVVINKYNSVVELNEQLTSDNKQLNISIAKLGGELQTSEADKLNLMANIKAQEAMFNDHLNALADVTEQQTAVQTQLKEVFIYEQVNEDWGNTMLPDDVKRVLFNATRTQDNNNNKASAGATTGLPP